MDHHTVTTPLIRYPPSNNSLLSSGNTKKAIAYEPRTEAISPATNDDVLTIENSTSKSTKDEQTLLIEKLKKVEAEILQTDQKIGRLRDQKAQLEQAQSCVSLNNDDDQENVCDTKQLSIAKLVYHENRAKAQKAHSKLDCLGVFSRDLPVYNQPSDNAIYHQNAVKFANSFKTCLIACFRERLEYRLKLEELVSTEYDRRMEKWLKRIEQDDSQPNKRMIDAKTREFFEKQFPELKKARESGERFSRVGQRVARSDAELAELLDGITEREDQDKKVKSYAVIPPMLEEMRSRKPKYTNRNGYVEDIIAEYKEYQILNTWTDEEKDIFRENYLQHPKNFGLIASVTSRKNVANCVQYYYMSKKSENYKQLLKRQQKRRTRSFVRPAQQTAANTATNNESSNDNKANGFNSNDKQGGDNNNGHTENNGQNLTGQSDASKSSALIDSDTSKQLDSSDANIDSKDDGINQTNCCICDCEFNQTNQFRNVTRSNHQLYGIGIDTLKPGMKICYSCRFRHVTHPSFDDHSMDPDIYKENDDDLTSMEVDQPVIQTETQPVIDNDDVSEAKQNIPSNQMTSPTQEPIDVEMGTLNNNCQGNKNPQRTCVRDIIYQAIEMSFQKPKTSDSMDTLLKVEPAPPLPPEAVQINPVTAQHSMPPILPLKPVAVGTNNHTIPPPNTMSTHLPFQNMSVDSQHQHIAQLQQQKHQQQLQMEYTYRTQEYFSRLQRQNQELQRQLQQEISRQPQPQPQPPPQPQSQPPAPAPPSTKIFPAPSPSLPLAHPLNLCRKYVDPPPIFQEPVRSQTKPRPPPMAHGAKVVKTTPPRVACEQGVLNLSKQSQPNSVPAPAPLPQAQACLPIPADVANLANQQHIMQMIQQQQHLQQQQQHQHQQLQHQQQLQQLHQQQLHHHHHQQHLHPPQPQSIPTHHQPQLQPTHQLQLPSQPQPQSQHQQHQLQAPHAQQHHVQHQQPIHAQHQQPIHTQQHQPLAPPQIQHQHQATLPLSQIHQQLPPQLQQPPAQQQQQQQLHQPPQLSQPAQQQQQPQQPQQQQPAPPPPPPPQEQQQSRPQPPAQSQQAKLDLIQTPPPILAAPAAVTHDTAAAAAAAAEAQDPTATHSPSRVDSRSPNLTGSPTSPSEMVIDESASPTSSDQDETAK